MGAWGEGPDLPRAGARATLTMIGEEAARPSNTARPGDGSCYAGEAAVGAVYFPYASGNRGTSGRKGTPDRKGPSPSDPPQDP